MSLIKPLASTLNWMCARTGGCARGLNFKREYQLPSIRSPPSPVASTMPSTLQGGSPGHWSAVGATSPVAIVRVVAFHPGVSTVPGESRPGCARSTSAYAGCNPLALQLREATPPTAG
jgi:hypothetical protein